MAFDLDRDTRVESMQINDSVRSLLREVLPLVGGDRRRVAAVRCVVPRRAFMTLASSSSARRVPLSASVSSACLHDATCASTVLAPADSDSSATAWRSPPSKLVCARARRVSRWRRVPWQERAVARGAGSRGGGGAVWVCGARPAFRVQADDARSVRLQ